jgi:3-phosphoglycerate kinase
MKPASARLAELLGAPVTQAADVIGGDAREKAAALRDGEVLVLENVRFHPEEEKNDPAFAKELASLADIYVNDAFGTAHRAHASTEGVTKYLPSVCGFLIKKEIDFMGTALSNPARPFVAILGGAKVSDKIKVIENLIDKCDSIIIGGGMAYTFIRAKGYGVGASLCEEDKIGLASELLNKAEARGVEFLLPIDTIVAKEFRNDAESKNVAIDSMPDGWMGLDIGPNAIMEFSAVVSDAKTVVWNGPMGVFEMPNFEAGTKEIARALSESDAISIVGGGDSVAAIEQFGLAGKFSHISTGGGASLEFLEGVTLPGIAALMDK